MLPHLAGNQQRHHAHFTASCPLNCPARRSHPHAAPPVQGSFPRLDASKLHPAFSGLFYQQRRSHFHQAHASIPSPPSLQQDIHMSPASTRSCNCHQTPHHPTIQCISVQPLAPPPPPPLPPMMDPARTSPIFYGYAPNHDKAKM
ncbi:hypothetical protein MVEG_10288 [Podila verticillata NRRL 6337]|nr:hypothetical protein MVEG_10288 [Podila verticillata NRRL 6337]